MSKIKVILSDLDGVIRHYPISHSADAENSLGLEPGGLLSIAFQRKYLESVTTGIMTDEQWREQIATELELRFEKNKVKTVLSQWTAFPGQLDQQVSQFYRSKKSDCKIALLTNGTTKLMTDLKILGISDLFDVVYNTCEIGFAKPDPRTFHYVLNTIGYPAHEILFVDDREINTRSAQSLGFAVHQFNNFNDLQKIILGSI